MAMSWPLHVHFEVVGCRLMKQSHMRFAAPTQLEQKIVVPRDSWQAISHLRFQCYVVSHIAPFLSIHGPKNAFRMNSDAPPWPRKAPLLLSFLYMRAYVYPTHSPSRARAPAPLSFWPALTSTFGQLVVSVYLLHSCSLLWMRRACRHAYPRLAWHPDRGGPTGMHPRFSMPRICRTLDSDDEHSKDLSVSLDLDK